MSSHHDPRDVITSAYDQYADTIFRHCAYRVFDRERGKDLMQETFLRAWQYLQSGKEVENMRALLYRIANNLIIDTARRKKESSLDALQEQGFDPPGDTAETITGAIDNQEFLRVMGKLPAASRELIVMRYIDDMKPREIASLLGLEPNTVSVRIHRALQDLASLLQP